MFKGYNLITVMVACNLAFSGLLVSWIMKFADSILKVFSTSMAMLLTMLISVTFFDTALTLQVRLQQPLPLHATCMCVYTAVLHRLARVLYVVTSHTRLQIQCSTALRRLP